MILSFTTVLKNNGGIEMTKTKAFNNRALELVRNFVIIDRELEEGQSYTFNLSDDPFEMIFLVNNGHLFTVVNIHATQGQQSMYEIASIDHIERLLYMADGNKTQSEHIQLFKELLQDEYFLFLLEEYLTRDIYSVSTDEMETIQSGNADLKGHIEQLHICATAINTHDKKLVKAMKDLIILVNSDETQEEDFKEFKKTVEAL